MGRKKSGYIFTNKRQSRKGIMATLLGLLSIASLIAAVILSYRAGGRAAVQYGAVGLLTTVYSLAGLTLGVLSRTEKDKYYLFSYLGIGLNVISLLMISLILYAGVYAV